MNTFLTQCTFQILMALNFFEVTLQSQFRWPVVVATGNGKRSQPRSSVYNPEAMDRKWTYRHLNDGQTMALLRDGNKWDTPTQWKLQTLPKRNGVYLTSDTGSQRMPETFGNGDQTVETGSYGLDGLDTILEELPMSNEADQRLDDMTQYGTPSDYTGSSSIYSSSPFMKSLLGLKRRESILAMLENRLRSAEFDDE